MKNLISNFVDLERKMSDFSKFVFRYEMKKRMKKDDRASFHSWIITKENKIMIIFDINNKKETATIENANELYILFKAEKYNL